MPGKRKQMEKPEQSMGEQQEGMVDGVPEFIVEKCIRCGICYVRCPQIIKKWKKEEEEDT